MHEAHSSHFFGKQTLCRENRGLFGHKGEHL
jgi:hypothetical protein